MLTEAEAWRGQRVLVTGHTGFKGAWLCAWLHRLGAEVVGLSLEPPSHPYLFEEARLGEWITTHRADVADEEAVAAVLDAEQPQWVFHLAAQTIVRESYRRPLETLRSNVMGTAVLLDALRRREGLRAALVITSDKCYAGEPPPTGHGEDDRLGGDDPYSMSKAGAELVTASWRRSFGDELPPMASARAGNVIGGGDWGRDRLLPDAVRAAQQGQKLQLRSPEAVRPWQHVLDVLSGYLQLAQALAAKPEAFASGWNFAPPPADVTVRTLVDRFYAALGRGEVRVSTASDEGMAEKVRLVVDPRRAREALGWEVKLGVEDAVEWTAQWYRAWLEDPALARAQMLEQVERFEGLHR